MRGIVSAKPIRTDERTLQVDTKRLGTAKVTACEDRAYSIDSGGQFGGRGRDRCEQKGRGSMRRQFPADDVYRVPCTGHDIRACRAMNMGVNEAGYQPEVRLCNPPR